MARIAIGGMHHETNSFAPVKATLEDFVRADGWPPLCEGPALLREVAGMNLPISGFIDATKEQHELLPLMWCSAPPSAPVRKSAYEELVGKLLHKLDVELPLDAVFLDLHGAMIAEHILDGDGELLRRVREVIGRTPLAVSFDMHANISEQMIGMADWIVGYRTYPHLDMADTGKRAAAGVEQMLQHNYKPMKLFRRLPFLIPITSQTTLTEPMRGIMHMAKSLSTNGDTLEFFTGFPPADTPDTGPIAIGCGYQPELSEAVHELQAHAINLERAFHSELLPAKEAVAEAMQRYDGKPIIIADTQDNPGAGGNGDTVGLLDALIKAVAKDAVFAIVNDPQSAAKAHKLGVGAQGVFSIGGSNPLPGQTPFRGQFTVDHITDGEFTCTGPMFGGTQMRLGLMAVLRLAGVKVVVSSIKHQCADLAMLRHVGIEPEKEKILAIKSSVHFRADFEAIAGDIILAEAPGPNIENPENIPYKHLRTGIRLRPGGPEFQPNGGYPSAPARKLSAY